MTVRACMYERGESEERDERREKKSVLLIFDIRSYIAPTAPRQLPLVVYVWA